MTPGAGSTGPWSPPATSRWNRDPSLGVIPSGAREWRAGNEPGSRFGVPVHSEGSRSPQSTISGGTGGKEAPCWLK